MSPGTQWQAASADWQCTEGFQAKDGVAKCLTFGVNVTLNAVLSPLNACLAMVCDLEVSKQAIQHCNNTTGPSGCTGPFGEFARLPRACHTALGYDLPPLTRVPSKF